MVIPMVQCPNISSISNNGTVIENCPAGCTRGSRGIDDRTKIGFLNVYWRPFPLRILHQLKEVKSSFQRVLPHAYEVSHCSNFFLYTLHCFCKVFTKNK